MRKHYKRVKIDELPKFEPDRTKEDGSQSGKKIIKIRNAFDENHDMVIQRKGIKVNHSKKGNHFDTKIRFGEFGPVGELEGVVEQQEEGVGVRYLIGEA